MLTAITVWTNWFGGGCYGANFKVKVYNHFFPEAQLILKLDSVHFDTGSFVKEDSTIVGNIAKLAGAITVVGSNEKVAKQLWMGGPISGNIVVSVWGWGPTNPGGPTNLERFGNVRFDLSGKEEKFDSSGEMLVSTICSWDGTNKQKVGKDEQGNDIYQKGTWQSVWASAKWIPIVTVKNTSSTLIEIELYAPNHNFDDQL